jgi:hypothetical protein
VGARACVCMSEITEPLTVEIYIMYIPFQESTYRIMTCCVLIVSYVHLSVDPQHIQCS